MNVGRSLLFGLLIWLGGTVAIRLMPGRLFAAGHSAAILLLYAVSFVTVYLLLGLSLRDAADAARARGMAIALVLPTLVLDAVAALFFPAAYPNLPPESAGIFAGWMMSFCAGGLAASLRRA